MLWSRSCINSSGMTTELPTSSTQEGVQHHYYLYVQTHTERERKINTCTAQTHTSVDV